MQIQYVVEPGVDQNVSYIIINGEKFKFVNHWCAFDLLDYMKSMVGRPFIRESVPVAEGWLVTLDNGYVLLVSQHLKTIEYLDVNMGHSFAQAIELKMDGGEHTAIWKIRSFSGEELRKVRYPMSYIEQRGK